VEPTRDTLQKLVAEMLGRVPKEQAPVVASKKFRVAAKRGED